MNVLNADFEPQNVPALLTEKDVADLSRLSPAMLQKMRREGCGPAFVRIGSIIRYPASAVSTWIHSLKPVN